MCNVINFLRRHAELFLKTSEQFLQHESGNSVELEMPNLRFANHRNPLNFVSLISHLHSQTTYYANSEVKMQKSNEIIAILKIPPTKSQLQLSGAAPHVALYPLLETVRNKCKSICGNKGV